MNDIIVQQNIILICKALSHFYNSNKRIKTYITFNEFFFMNFYTYMEETIKNIFSIKLFNFS
jgi:hypothetical protein